MAEPVRPFAGGELDALLDQVSDGVYVLDPAWRFVFFNKACEAFFDRRRADVLGRSVWDVFSASIATEVERELREAHRSRAPRRFEFNSVAVPGTIVQMEVSPSPDGGLAVVFKDVSARRAAELARSQTERMLRDVTDAMPVLISYIDAEQRFVFANRAYETWFGRPLGQIIGYSAREVLGEAFYELRRPYLERALGGEHVAYEVPFARDGRQTLVQHFPNPDGNGRVLGIYTLVQDLSDLRQAEQRLAESQARLEIATEASQLGVWEWRLDTGDFILSSRARAIWGFAEDTPLRLEDLDAALHPEDSDRVKAQAEHAFDPAAPENQPYEYRIRRPDGEWRWVRAHGRAIFEQGKAVRYVGAMEDVTERRQMQEELRASEARLRLAVSAGRMAVWSLDVRTGEVGVTPEFNRIVGLPAHARPTLEELQAQYYPGELDRLQQLAVESLGKGEPFFEAEYRHIRVNDGSVRWLLVRAEFQMSAEGQPTECIGVVFDVTERKAEEERVRLLAREVDHRANNLLTIVQSVVALTKAETVADYQRALGGRINALAGAHQLLAASRWQGADLQTLVSDELRPYAVDGARRWDIKGEPVSLTPELAQSIALSIHELATNAVKHGALSVMAGMVSVAWSRQEDGGWRLVWRESGGPTVHSPSRRGMGMKLLERAFAARAGGRIDLDWRPEGLACAICFSLDAADRG